jgi:hypothetical protein
VVVGVLMTAMRMMFVWPGVGVGVVQGAVTVQIALDEFIDGGGHG